MAANVRSAREKAFEGVAESQRQDHGKGPASSRACRGPGCQVRDSGISIEAMQIDSGLVIRRIEQIVAPIFSRAIRMRLPPESHLRPRASLRLICHSLTFNDRSVPGRRRGRASKTSLSSSCARLGFRSSNCPAPGGLISTRRQGRWPRGV